MLLPRPILDYPLVIDFVRSKFKEGDIAYLFGDKYEYIGIGEKTLAVYLRNAKGKQVKFGVLNFYCNVTNDIGVAKVVNEYEACQWLLAGVDGVANIDRLCKAWSDNGELLPRDDEKGKRLKSILEEANRAIKDDLKDTVQAFELLDQRLTKYNTFFQQLYGESFIGKHT